VLRGDLIPPKVAACSVMICLSASIRRATALEGAAGAWRRRVSGAAKLIVASETSPVTQRNHRASSLRRGGVAAARRRGYYLACAAASPATALPALFCGISILQITTGGLGQAAAGRGRWTQRLPAVPSLARGARRQRLTYDVACWQAEGREREAGLPLPQVKNGEEVTLYTYLHIAPATPRAVGGHLAACISL